MSPSRFVIPNLCSPDRQRARKLTISLERAKYAHGPDDLEGDPGEGFALPTRVLDLPREQDFDPSRQGRLFLDKQNIRFNSRQIRLLRPFGNKLNSLAAYRRLYRSIVGPHRTMHNWMQDEEFGRQRLTGVNPMSIRRFTGDPELGELEAAGRAAVAQRYPDQRLADDRLYMVSYPLLWDERVQRRLGPGAVLAAPTCLFWADMHDRLMPLAIQLKPPGEPYNPVFTPVDPPYDWLLARAHVQCADAHYHEGVFHLLETHMVGEVIALALLRNLHPDHPLRQLLGPHFRYTMAINNVARGNLLSAGGPIDLTMAAGAGGTLNAARLVRSQWDYRERTLHADLERRDVGAVPNYHYRDDARAIWKALHRYVKAMLARFYPVEPVEGDDSRHIRGDHELQAFLAEAGNPDRGGLRGFPTEISQRSKLEQLCTELIFRAGPQHSAVNNGQYDAYGWVPNTPGSLSSPLPKQRPPVEGRVQSKEFWRAFPDRKQALAQVGMTWVLSASTTRNLLSTGRVPAFSPEVDFEASEHVRALRVELLEISRAIRQRNLGAKVPYVYLDPLNIGLGTDI